MGSRRTPSLWGKDPRRRPQQQPATNPSFAATEASFYAGPIAPPLRGRLLSVCPCCRGPAALSGPGLPLSPSPPPPLLLLPLPPPAKRRRASSGAIAKMTAAAAARSWWCQHVAAASAPAGRPRFVLNLRVSSWKPLHWRSGWSRPRRPGYAREVEPPPAVAPQTLARKPQRRVAWTVAGNRRRKKSREERQGNYETTN